MVNAGCLQLLCSVYAVSRVFLKCFSSANAVDMHLFAFDEPRPVICGKLADKMGKMGKMGRTDGGDTAMKHTQRLRLIRDVSPCACGGLMVPSGTHDGCA